MGKCFISPSIVHCVCFSQVLFPEISTVNFWKHFLVCTLSVIFFDFFSRFITNVVFFNKQDVVNNICDNEDIKAVSFVGSNIVSDKQVPLSMSEI